MHLQAYMVFRWQMLNITLRNTLKRGSIQPLWRSLRPRLRYYFETRPLTYDLRDNSLMLQDRWPVDKNRARSEGRSEGCKALSSVAIYSPSDALCSQDWGPTLKPDHSLMTCVTTNLCGKINDLLFNYPRTLDLLRYVNLNILEI